MVEKICVVCKKPFDARYNRKTCSDKCSAIRDHENRRNYYLNHSTKWKWYREMSAVEQLGTSNLVGSARRNRDGSINQRAETSALKRELKRLGLP